MASVAAGAASAASCFRLGLVVEWEVAQHGALAAVVYEVAPGLVAVFPDGGHDGHDLPADAAAGQAGAPHAALADGHGLSFLFMMLGNSCTGATGRPSDGPVADLLTGGVGACPGRCGAETVGAVSALAKWARPLVEAARALDRLCQGCSEVDLRLGRLLSPLAEEQERNTCCSYSDGWRTGGFQGGTERGVRAL